jgi:hypothetical protein
MYPDTLCISNKKIKPICYTRDISVNESVLDKNLILVQSTQNILGQIDKATQGILQLFG